MSNLNRRSFAMFVLAVLLCVLAIAQVPAAAQAPAKRHVTVLTYGSGGSNYVQAGGVVKVGEKYLANTTVTVQPTGGDLEMVRLLDQRKGDFAFVMLNSALYAYTGKAPYDRKYDWARMFLVGQNATVHLVVPAKSTVKSVVDLKGKKVAIGPAGSSLAALMVPTILKASGLSLQDIKGQFLSVSETAQGLKDDTLDAGFFYLILPAPAVTDLTTSNAMKFIPLEEKVRQQIKKDSPMFDLDVIAKGTYRGQDVDVPTVGLACAIMTHKDVPNDTIYDLAKALDVHMADWKEIHPGSAYYTPQKTAQYLVIPAHPGMEKYLKEKGLVK
jgi:TRAP transporter TAXI family solute receptor